MKQSDDEGVCVTATAPMQLMPLVSTCQPCRGHGRYLGLLTRPTPASCSAQANRTLGPSVHQAFGRRCIPLLDLHRRLEAMHRGTGRPNNLRAEQLGECKLTSPETCYAFHRRLVVRGAGRSWWGSPTATHCPSLAANNVPRYGAVDCE